MHDLKSIRENPAAFDAALARRGIAPISETILNVDAVRRDLQRRIELLSADRKNISGQFGQLAALGQGNTPEALALKDRSVSVGQEITNLVKELAEAKEVNPLLASIPNLPFDEVPEGSDENDNVEVSRWGTPRAFDFDVKDHSEIGPPLGLDFETGVKLSGARFTFMRGQMARLNRALGQFMLDRQTVDNGYSECATPYLVRDAAMFGTGQLPKFGEDSFSTMKSVGALEWVGNEVEYLSEFRQSVTDNASIHDYLDRIERRLDEILKSETFDSLKDRHWLIPTAEVSLTNSVAGDILDEAALPIRMTALTPCFRSEAGAAGKDTKGLIRQHQFEKVELVSITRPEDSVAEHERMTAAAESVLQALNLPYRKLLLCTGDMGFGARKTYDLEVWLPGQGLYREISSCSNCGDFQARRMNARYRPVEGKGTAFVHTLNGSGLAVGRTLVAVIENYQNADGSVSVPDVLKPYMGGLEILTPQ